MKSAVQGMAIASHLGKLTTPGGRGFQPPYTSKRQLSCCSFLETVEELGIHVGTTRFSRVAPVVRGRRGGNEWDDRLTGSSKLAPPASSSESGPELVARFLLLLMFSSRFCRRISTCCSSRRRRSSSCLKPPLLFLKANERTVSSCDRRRQRGDILARRCSMFRSIRWW